MTATVHPGAVSGGSFLRDLNSRHHELALRVYLLIVIAHWAEHVLQAFQIWALGMPRPEARGALGMIWPWLVSSEWLHYVYAIVMLIGLVILRPGFQGRSLAWWNVALWIQVWHHFEHLILLGQALFQHNLFGKPVPTSLVQLIVPRVELHLIYNAVVFAPMLIAMYYHLRPPSGEAPPTCSCGTGKRLRSQGAGAAAAVLAAFWLASCAEVPVSEIGTEGRPDTDVAAVVSDTQSDSGAGTTSGTLADLKPGHFESPLVRLRRLQGEQGHLHVDEVRYRAEDKRLFQCSYTFGVVNAEDPARMSYLAQSLRHDIPDDTRRPGCMHLAYDGNIVYTTHRGNIRNPTFLSGWDVSTTDPENPDRMMPTQIPVLQEPDTSYEGVDVADGYVFVAIRTAGLGIYARDPETNALSRVGTLADIGNTWGVRVYGDTAYVTDIDGHLVIADVSDPTAPSVLGRVEIHGVPKGVVVADGIAYVAAGSEGLVSVDVSNPSAPSVLGGVDTPGPALRVDYSEGRIFLAAWTDARVYDVADPARPELIGAVRLTTDVVYDDDGHAPVTARTKGIAADGNNIFVGNWWVLYSYRLYPERKAPYALLPEDVNLMDFGPVAVGETATNVVSVKNDGTAPLTVFNAWSTNAAFEVAQTSLRIEPGEVGELAVSYRGGSARETAFLNLWTDDPQQPVRSAFLVANQEGLGVGQRLPETVFALLDGSDWSTSEADGEVVVLSYFATFCPVCAEHVPELERHYWRKYRDQGVVVVGANFHDASVDGGMDGVRNYIDYMGNTHPVGLEDGSTPTYTALTANYKGANPFPVDVVVGRDGVILYVSREYDPDGLEAAIEAALAN